MARSRSVEAINHDLWLIACVERSDCATGPPLDISGQLAMAVAFLLSLRAKAKVPFRTGSVKNLGNSKAGRLGFRQITSASTETEKAARRVLISRIDRLRWCFWHAQREKAKNRMQGILTLCRVIVPETPGVADSLAQLDYRARELVAYVDANGGATINYGARHRQNKPISTAPAESAVNQVLNQRMCKRQQMRWSPNGVHLLAQVRCAVINGDLIERLARYEPPTEPRSREVVEFLEQLGLSEFEPQGF